MIGDLFILWSCTRGLQPIFVKDQMANILGFQGHVVSDRIIQLWHCSVQTTTGMSK